MESNEFGSACILRAFDTADLNNQERKMCFDGKRNGNLFWHSVSRHSPRSLCKCLEALSPALTFMCPLADVCSPSSPKILSRFSFLSPTAEIYIGAVMRQNRPKQSRPIKSNNFALLWSINPSKLNRFSANELFLSMRRLRTPAQPNAGKKPRTKSDEFDILFMAADSTAIKCVSHADNNNQMRSSSAGRAIDSLAQYISGSL